MNIIKSLAFIVVALASQITFAAPQGPEAVIVQVTYMQKDGQSYYGREYENRRPVELYRLADLIKINHTDIVRVRLSIEKNGQTHYWPNANFALTGRGFRQTAITDHRIDISADIINGTARIDYAMTSLENVPLDRVATPQAQRNRINFVVQDPLTEELVTVGKLYKLGLSRVADPGGARFYAEHLAQGTSTVAQVLADLLKSPESRRDVVGRIRQELGRNASEVNVADYRLKEGLNTLLGMIPYIPNQWDRFVITTVECHRGNDYSCDQLANRLVAIPEVRREL